jgi:GNAT superfamily N-acetyltransferase
MIYRKAEPNEAVEIMALIRDAVAHMEAVGVQQWSTAYPTLAFIEKDIHTGTGYVLADEDEIAAYVCVNEDQPAEYADIHWEFAGNCCVVHRLVVSVKRQGQGLSKQMIRHYEEQAIRDGFDTIRLDTYSKNPISMKLYPSMGYVRRGEVRFFHHMEEFPVFEKQLRM